MMLSRKSVLFSSKLNKKWSFFSKLKDFTDLDPSLISAHNNHIIKNLVNGSWISSTLVINVLDPLNGSNFISVPNTQSNELNDFLRSLGSCSKSGLHNPLKNPERYLMYGEICANASRLLQQPDVFTFFVKLIQRVVPKSETQSSGEVKVCLKFLENFCGDQVRFLARSFNVPGDHYGQQSSGYRWPYGPVVIIAPFNFPLEIPLLQLMGALFMGNKVLLKVDSKVAIVMEQMLKLLHFCGLPLTDVDFINCEGHVMHELLLKAKPRMTQFTGSSKVAEILARELAGRIRIEDAGWDWKLLGPDVVDVDYVAYTCDQDANAFSGQKCSAQSALFVHSNWAKTNFYEKIKSLATHRSLKNLTLSPILTVTNERFSQHVASLLKINGAKVLYGGDFIEEHSIPSCFGSWKPTAVMVPVSEFLKADNFSLCCTEIFGPFQIIVEYNDEELDLVLDALENCEAFLTAAIVSSNINFQNKVLARTINGTTYTGIRARTTGAPQNHWFGPAGDPRAAGIGTPEAIKLVWSCHREIVSDQGPVPTNWKIPPST